MKKLICFLMLFALTNGVCIAQCPPEGREAPGKKPLTEREKQLNVRKNASAAIPDINAVFVDIKNIINKPKNDDSKQFEEGGYVYIMGFLVLPEEEGPESCNCHTADADKKTGDVHIYIGLSANADKKDCIIVEITPAYKALHPDYETTLAQLTGKNVKITGYLVYDYLHEKNSVNMCKACGADIWRKSCWELHPIVDIEKI